MRESFNGPFIVDLLTHQITPAIDAIALESGVYRSIELKLAKLEKDKLGADIDEHDAMIGESIILHGTYTPIAGKPKSLSLSLVLDEEFRLNLAGDRSGVNVVADQVNTLIIGFGLYKWFDFSGQVWDLSDIISDSNGAKLM